jgi:fructosamine-3-kinase
MHRHTSKNGMYGWDINNTIGATPQPNTWTADWATFWDEQRLGYMLRKCRSMDEYPREKELRAKVKDILSNHDCVPSLVHGDLWSGNQAYTTEGDPVIFDPATYVSNTY